MEEVQRFISLLTWLNASSEQIFVHLFWKKPIFLCYYLLGEGEQHRLTDFLCHVLWGHRCSGVASQVEASTAQPTRAHRAWLDVETEERELPPQGCQDIISLSSWPSAALGISDQPHAKPAQHPQRPHVHSCSAISLLYAFVFGILGGANCFKLTDFIDWHMAGRLLHVTVCSYSKSSTSTATAGWCFLLLSRDLCWESNIKEFPTRIPTIFMMWGTATGKATKVAAEHRGSSPSANTHA